MAVSFPAIRTGRVLFPRNIIFHILRNVAKCSQECQEFLNGESQISQLGWNSVIFGRRDRGKRNAQEISVANPIENTDETYLKTQEWLRWQH
jgi:hypothetical protein